MSEQKNLIVSELDDDLVSMHLTSIERLARRCLPEFRDYPDLIQEKLLLVERDSKAARIAAFETGVMIGYCIVGEFTAPGGARYGGVRCLLVDPARRRRHVGAQLVRAAEAKLARAGAARAWLYATPNNYLYPGAPAHDADICAFAQALGYAPGPRTIDIGVDLLCDRSWPPMDQVALRPVGERSADLVNAGTLRAFVRIAFPGFANEVERALAAAEPIAYVVLSEGEIVGFCVAGALNLPLGGVGPAGVLHTHRGRTVFRCLVQACMIALKERGYGFARMQWADRRAPAFYKRAFDGFVCGEYCIYWKDL